MGNKKKAVTIHDLAQELNVSPSTVSRALNDHSSIGNRTKKAVKKLESLTADEFEDEVFAMKPLSQAVEALPVSVLERFQCPHVRAIPDRPRDQGDGSADVGDRNVLIQGIDLRSINNKGRQP